MKEHRPLKEQQGLAGGTGTSGNGSASEQKQCIGNYDLVRRIDVGGMGEVYLAHQRSAFGREVAVKIMRPDLVHDITARKRFLREAEVSAHLKHDHILPLFEFGEEDGRLFLVTPYIDGGTLAKRLQSGPVALSEVHQLFTALVRAVAYIHKRGVVHRDLKPSNILLDREEGTGQVYVRLIDFGIATIQGMSASPPLTMAGNEMGTLAYMAPERLSHVAAPSNDIYSLGIILYQMLTGQLPASGKTLPLPQPLINIVRRCTMPNPNERFASADELLASFEEAYRAISVPAQAKAIVAPDLPDLEDMPTPKRVTTTKSRSFQPSRPAGAATDPNALDASKATLQEAALSRNADIVLPEPAPAILSSGSVRAFKSNDYSAPTVAIGPDHLSPQQKQQLDAVSVGNASGTAGATGSVVGAPPADKRKWRVSLFGFVSIFILVVFLIVAGLGYIAFQTAISAQASLSPQVRQFSSVLTITAKPDLQNVDASTASIPAEGLSSRKTSTMDAPTTGQDCIFGFFRCQPFVSFSDVDDLVTQMRPELKAQLGQDLQRQAQSSGVTLVGNVQYSDANVLANPPIGTPGKKVTVTLTEKGDVEGIKTTDVQAVARPLLEQQMHKQFGVNYILLDQQAQSGQPIVQNVDASGNVTIQIAAGGLAEYHIPSDQLQRMKNHLEGMKLAAARAYLASQEGIDPATVNLHISYGDVFPKNVQQIKIVVVDANTTNLPPVKLPTVKPTPPPDQ